MLEKSLLMYILVRGILKDFNEYNVKNIWFGNTEVIKMASQNKSGIFG